MINLSLIIPHKNSLKTLVRLLGTIPLCKDFQIIVVDDNSEESIQNELCAITSNSNVELYFNKGCEGAGAARNVGLNHAIGKWILFADADDFFSENLENIIRKYFNCAADVVYFKTTSSYNDTGKEAKRHLRYNKFIENFQRSAELKNSLLFQYTPPWGRIIRKEIIDRNDIKFEEVRASNDIMFSLKVGNVVDKILVDDAVLYCITVTEGSLTNSFNFDVFNSRFYVALRANKFLREIRHSEFQLSILYYLGRSYKFGFRYMLKVICEIIRYRANPFIGIEKIFRLKEVLRGKERKGYIKRDNAAKTVSR